LSHSEHIRNKGWFVNQDISRDAKILTPWASHSFQDFHFELQQGLSLRVNDMWAWITREANPIMAVAAVLGLFATCVGFGFTYYQLHQATNQLQAGNEYTIRKDLRDLVSETIPKLKLQCLEVGSVCSADDVTATKQSLGLLFNFHQSVYRQASASGISETFKKQMASDFCQAFKRPTIEKFWEEQIASGNYDLERQEMRDKWCGKKS
jgi:hypothetical protein